MWTRRRTGKPSAPGRTFFAAHLSRGRSGCSGRRRLAWAKRLIRKGKPRTIPPPPWRRAGAASVHGEAARIAAETQRHEEAVADVLQAEAVELRTTEGACGAGGRAVVERGVELPRVRRPGQLVAVGR